MPWMLLMTAEYLSHPIKLLIRAQKRIHQLPQLACKFTSQALTAVHKTQQPSSRSRPNISIATASLMARCAIQISSHRWCRATFWHNSNLRISSSTALPTSTWRFSPPKVLIIREKALHRQERCHTAHQRRIKQSTNRCERRLMRWRMHNRTFVKCLYEEKFNNID